MVRACQVELPESVRSRLVIAGATEEKAPGEELHLIRIDDGTDSPAWCVFRDWVCGLGEADPLVLPFFSPSKAIVGTALAPSLALIGPLLTEIASILVHHAPIPNEAFACGPPTIPGPLVAPQLPVNVHGSQIAVIAMIACIQRPPASYPVLSALGAGSYICHLFYQWLGVGVTIAVFKP